MSDKEIKQYEKLNAKFLSEKLSIIRKELKRATTKLNQFGIGEKESIKKICELALDFKEEILLLNKTPIWWDFERFVHIYMRHVSETKVGEHFENKTIFQYRFEDIKRLIRCVLDTIEDEIKSHFKDNPEKDFKRHGEMSAYYKGDFYNIHIKNTGLLMTFYKNN